MNTHLNNVPASELVRELLERGVLQGYGASKYVPAAVVKRYEGTEDFDKIIHSQMVHELAKSLVSNHIVDVSVAPATETDPGAPPNDKVYRTMVLTLNPAVELDDRPEPGASLC